MYVYAASGYGITNSYIAHLNGNGGYDANFVGSSTSGFNDFISALNLMVADLACSVSVST